MYAKSQCIIFLKYSKDVCFLLCLIKVLQHHPRTATSAILCQIYDTITTIIMVPIDDKNGLKLIYMAHKLNPLRSTYL